jgi:hypothetical protein
MKPYSRTADAESVVLNFAKVLTYSRVLLYTLSERKKGKDEREREGRRGGESGLRRKTMSAREGKEAKHGWLVLEK